MLRDIHLPDAVSWWPPAIGWWLLLALIILSIIFIPRLYRYLSYTPLNKVAITSFEQITAVYNKNKDSNQLVVDTSRLLRQIAMSYYSREQVAQLTGDKWIDTLNSITTKTIFSDKLKQSIVNAPYQKQAEIDPENLIQCVNEWLHALPKRPGAQQHA